MNELLLMDDIESSYLTGIPQENEKYGLCKTLIVRREIIHIKHIFTEIFVRKSIDIHFFLNKLDLCLFDYMEVLTNKIRKIHHFSRLYRHDFNNIVKLEKCSFFKSVNLYDGLNNIIVLDFDGVVTENNFRDLYNLCIERCRTVICSANPTIKEEWFIKKGLPLPYKIYSCKGKIQKINTLLDINKKYDNVFYVDNEEEYLKYAWLFGVKTYHYNDNKIKYFTLKTK